MSDGEKRFPKSPETILAELKSRKSYRIKCGRKIFCVDQLYGWRGMDCGYYGSEESDDLPDFSEERKMSTAENADGKEKPPGKEKEEEQELDMRPKFNILTDRAPTPNFSYTFIETSYSVGSKTADSDSLQTASVKDSAAVIIDEREKRAVAGWDENDKSSAVEPMEVDDSLKLDENISKCDLSAAYLRQLADCPIQDAPEAVTPTLHEDNSANLTYTVEQNSDEGNVFVASDENSSEGILDIRLEGKLITEKLPQAEFKDGTSVPVQTESQNEEHSVIVVGVGHVDEEAGIPISDKEGSLNAAPNLDFDHLNNVSNDNAGNVTFIVEQIKDALLVSDENNVTNEEDVELKLEGEFIIERLPQAEDGVTVPVPVHAEDKMEKRTVSMVGRGHVDEHHNLPVPGKEEALNASLNTAMEQSFDIDPSNVSNTAKSPSSRWDVSTNEMQQTIVHPLNEMQQTIVHPLNEVQQTTMHPPSNNAYSNSVPAESVALSPLPFSSKKAFACPAPLQTTFDLSRIEKASISSAGRNDSYLSAVSSNASRIPRSNLLEQMRGVGGVAKSPFRAIDRTVVSFKTPKQRIAQVKPAVSVTPLFKKKLTARGTSTPVEKTEYVCSRYASHLVALANRTTQTDNRTPTPLCSRTIRMPTPGRDRANRTPTPVRDRVNRMPTPVRDRVNRTPTPVRDRVNRMPTPVRDRVNRTPTPVRDRVNRMLTPVRNQINRTPTPVRNRSLSDTPLTPICRTQPSLLSHVSSGQPTPQLQPHTPSRIPVPTSAFKAICQYGTTPSPKHRRSASVGYESTPKSHKRSEKLTPPQGRTMANLADQSGDNSTSRLDSALHVPMTRFAFQHLKSGGTPRPVSKTRADYTRGASGGASLPEPITPVAKADISQMLVDNAMRSGPAYRRRPRPGTFLPPIGKLQFDKSTEKPDLECANEPSTAKQIQENIAHMEQGENIAHMEQGEDVEHMEQDENVVHMEQDEIPDATRVVVIDDSSMDEIDGLVNVTENLNISGRQNPSKKMTFLLDTTGDQSRKQHKTPIFDTSLKRRMVLSVLNESSVSVNTPGKEDELARSEVSPCAPDSSASPVHIIAAKDEQKQAKVLRARKIVHSEETEEGLRRSTRNRVAPIRRWLGEQPVYRRDEQGTFELVGVKEAVVTNSLYVKYNTVEMGEAIERQKREQKQHARARRLRQYARNERMGGATDSK